MMKVILGGLLAVAGAKELSKATWDAETAGKSVFVKFLAPWCGHCKSMKPAWDKLMAEYKDSKTVLIADVDCTADGKDMCEEVGVQGFPTIKYGDPNSLEDYEGGRDLAALQKFAKENLGPRCGPANLDLCTAEQKAQLEVYMAMPEAELKESVAEMEAKMKKADEEVEELLKSLQAQYEKGQEDNKAAKEKIKASGLGLMKSVKAHKKSGKSEL